MSKSTLSIVSKRFETTETKKGENSRPHIWCFETLKHIDYIVKLQKQIETGKKFLSPHFQLFRNISKHKQVKILARISGVSKQ